MTRLKLGLIVNPIAGVGAALAWKGTDDVDAAWQAVESGKPQPVWDLLSRAIDSIPPHIDITWLTTGNYPVDIDDSTVYEMPDHSQPQHTKEAVAALTEHDPDLILVVGGDGTAADVASITNVPILGIPAGVKIFSPCFLHRPEGLGSFLAHWEGETIEVDLLDLDEEAYRQGEAVPKLVTSATVPYSNTIQSAKTSWSGSDSQTYSLIAERIEEEGWLDKTILVGPGSTIQSIMNELGIEVSLLGVDVITKDTVIIYDGTKTQLDKQNIDEIWVSPIGNQGHIFGRGNRQISPELINRVGTSNIRVFATMEKIRQTPTLFVDTGDPDTDEDLRGFIAVITGYHESVMRRVE